MYFNFQDKMDAIKDELEVRIDSIAKELNDILRDPFMLLAKNGKDRDQIMHRISDISAMAVAIEPFCTEEDAEYVNALKGDILNLFYMVGPEWTERLTDAATGESEI